LSLYKLKMTNKQSVAQAKHGCNKRILLLFLVAVLLSIGFAQIDDLKVGYKTAPSNKKL
jgi:hypothetical protein